MFLRVLLITVGFSSISSEISKNTFTAFLHGKLNKNFSEALNLAFAAVPEIINTSKGITSILNPGKFIGELTYLTDVWHERFKTMTNRIFIVTGSQGKGKTTYIEEMTDDRTAGVYSKVVFDNDVRIPVVFREFGSGTLDVIQQALNGVDVSLSDLNIEMNFGTTEGIKQLNSSV